MIHAVILAAVFSAAVAAGSAWQVQAWRYGIQIAAIKTDQAQRAEAAVREALSKTTQLQRQKDEALNEAQKLAQRNAAAATAARADADSLRGQLATARDQLPGASCASIRLYAGNVGELFSACAAAYRDMAEEADRNATSARTLMDAWPRLP